MAPIRKSPRLGQTRGLLRSRQNFPQLLLPLSALGEEAWIVRAGGSVFCHRAEIGLKLQQHSPPPLSHSPVITTLTPGPPGPEYLPGCWVRLSDYLIFILGDLLLDINISRGPALSLSIYLS